MGRAAGYEKGSQNLRHRTEVATQIATSVPAAAHTTHDVYLRVTGTRSSLVRVVGGRCGTLDRLAFVLVRLADEVDRFLASEMGGPEDVGAIHTFGPNRLGRFGVSP